MQCEKFKSNLHYGSGTKRVMSGGAYLCGSGPGQHSIKLRKNIAAVASLWLHCVRFDRLGNRTPNLPRQKRCLLPLLLPAKTMPFTHHKIVTYLQRFCKNVVSIIKLYALVFQCLFQFDSRFYDRCTKNFCN